MTTQRLPLGTFVGARSGDKGGNANVGAWVVDPVEAAAVALAHGEGAGLEVTDEAVALADERFAWLLTVLTEDGVRALLPEARDLAIEVAPAREPEGREHRDPWPSWQRRRRDHSGRSAGQGTR